MKTTREYYLYANTPVLFEAQPDGGLLILTLTQDKRIVPDTSLYGLIHFDRDRLAQKISHSKFKTRLGELGVSEAAFEDAAQAMNSVAA